MLMIVGTLCFFYLCVVLSMAYRLPLLCYVVLRTGNLSTEASSAPEVISP